MSKFTNKNNKGRNVSDKRRAKSMAGRRSEEDRVEEAYQGRNSRPNDWRWYAQNEQLLRDTSSFPYSWPLGNKLNLGEYGANVNQGSLPGVMCIHTDTAFGWSDHPNSPINVAARNVYSYVRHANSGHANYDSPDLMLYLCAMDSIYSYLAYLKRIYGVVNTYNVVNRYFPVAVVRAMGVNFDDIQKNLADFRAFINSFAVKVGSMCIPASMSFMAKHMWMYSGLYSDSAQSKSQTYLFAPSGFYRFTLDQSGAGMLKYGLMEESGGSNAKGPTNPNDHYLSFADLVRIANLMLDPVLMSEDMNIMSGDILKAFGPEGIYKVDGIGETYTVLPAFNPEVLDQIQNLTLVGNYESDTANLVQSSDKSHLVFTPNIHHEFWFGNSANWEHPGQNAFVCDRFLTFEQDGVTPAMTMEASRMCNIGVQNVESGTTKYTLPTLGSEIAHYALIWYYNDNELTHSEPIYVGNTGVVEFKLSYLASRIQDLGSNAGNATTDQVLGDLKSAYDATSSNMRSAWSMLSLASAQISQFNRHPAVSFTLGIESDSTDDTTYVPVYSWLNGFQLDVNNYAIVGVDDLKVMAETALLSEFNVLQYGKAQQQ